jgi:disulfide bond formation protein DsbB
MISLIKTTLGRGALVTAGITSISLLALIMALIAEHVFGLAPCILCIYQRIPYLLGAGIALAGFVLFRFFGKPLAAQRATALCAVVFLAEAALAFYHSGVEQHWWVSIFEGCKVSFSDGGDLLAQIEQAQAVRCDEIPWQLFGLSMAAYNTLMSTGLFIVCAISAALQSKALLRP